jgi:GNAT superfamily N-acetyltransferase
VIRFATLHDVPRILILGRSFFNAAGWPKVTEWHEPSVTATLCALIEGKTPGGLMVAEVEGRVVGMAAFLVFPFYFNASAKVGMEIFWFVEPEHRNGCGSQLMTAIEDAAKEQGAGVFIMSSVAGLRDEALARVYARRGYAPAENTFIKRL